MLFILVLLCLEQPANLLDRAALVPPLVAAESSAAGLRVLRGTKVLAAPRLDGRLDDPVWDTAPVATDFTQNYPQGGAPPSRR